MHENDLFHVQDFQVFLFWFVPFRGSGVFWINLQFNSCKKSLVGFCVDGVSILALCLQDVMSLLFLHPSD